MIATKKNGIAFYQFPNFRPFPEITHGIFPRHGGVSPPPYDSLNAGFCVGDRDDHVTRNREIISRCIDLHDMIAVKQVHNDQVVVIKQNDRGGKGESTCIHEVGDALITQLPGCALMVTVADCQAVLLHDPVARVVANIHSGWRGSIINIIQRTVDAMGREFNCRPRNIVAGVGPSLGPCCAEFINYRPEIPPRFWSYKDAADHFDFWAVSRDQLGEAGVLREHIFSADMCTRCRTDTFFSYRAEGTTGRFAAVIGLR